MSNFINQLKPILQFFMSIVGVIILALVAGALGYLVHIYFGLALFVVIFIIGVAGSIKEYLNKGRKFPRQRRLKIKS